jgi:hypothetical protein
MSFKPFYFHSHLGQHDGDTPKIIGKRQMRGVTALFRPLTADEEVVLSEQQRPLQRLCAVQVTFCHPTDAFARKEGRSQAEKKEPVFINKRDIPDFCAKLENRVYSDKLAQGNAFNYLLKYVV